MIRTKVQSRRVVDVSRPCVAGGLAHRSPREPQRIGEQTRSLHRAGGFTLIEVLVVAVIVVLMLGMALPVFRAITGSRSEAGASNIIASVLGRARTDAIGLQQPVGMAVLYNSSTQITYLAEVQTPDCPTWTYNLTINPGGYFCSTYNGITYYFINNGIASQLPAPPTNSVPSAPPGSFFAVGGPPVEMMPQTDLLPLPTGIGAQTICNAAINNGGARLTDGYLNVGVILFDGYGRLASLNYGISQYSKLAVTAGMSADYPDPKKNVYYGNQFGVPSQYGLVVFQREAFVAQNFSADDPAYSSSNTSQQSDYSSKTVPSQSTEESWLDNNATPLLINRYNGNLN